MFDRLKDHPFAVDAFFRKSLVLTFAVPKAELQSLIPPCLSLDTYKDQHAFIAAAFVETEDLRPKGFPKNFGRDFFLIGYRIFVRYKTSDGRNLRGLYIIRSETDKSFMKFLGNVFTHYNYLRTDVSHHTNNNQLEIISKKSKLQVRAKLNDDAKLPAHSPFENWKDARKFAGPLPHTFTFNSKKNEVLIIKGIRQNWEPKPVEIIQNSIGFINELKLNNIVLANAFMVQNINYSWNAGVTDIWTPND